MSFILLADKISGISEPLTPEKLILSHSDWEEPLAGCTWKQEEIGGLSVYIGQSPDKKVSDHSLLPSPPRFFVCGECTSSLDVGRVLHKKGIFDEWDSVLALSQQAGRGQLRRPWASPAGNIYAAWRLPSKAPYADEMASLVAGLLLTEGFQQENIPVTIKWPNDLLLQDSKIGGILLEERGDLLMAGVGINVASHPPESALRDGWAVPAGAVQNFYSNFSAGHLWRTLVNHAIFCYLRQILLMKEEQLTRRVQEHLAWVGREVHVHGGDIDNRPGRILGVNQRGALRILQSYCEQGVAHTREHVIYSGSITPLPHHS